MGMFNLASDIYECCYYVLQQNNYNNLYLGIVFTIETVGLTGVCCKQSRISSTHRNQ